MRDMTDTGLPFAKMHGLGNDFLVIDGRSAPVDVTPALARALGDRHRGVGFDQLAVIAASEQADLALRFWNADGSESSTCGNATRCIARAELDRTGRKHLTIATERGILNARDASGGLTSVNLGAPRLLWHEIPLVGPMDTLELPIEGRPTATSMGNPHCTFFVEDAEAVDLGRFGPVHEHNPLFPQRTNVQVVQVLSRDRLRMRVWERGAGYTLASGSSSCAVTVAAARRGLTEREVTVVLDGGELRIRWAEDGVWMTGPTAHVFSGVLTPAFLEALA
ncbi:diaminopimelate epimerase [Rubellimicrobium rubrum]|uniref:Diaminopimelate epimerase n=1 Tax=Rubellimicrobium rubrum TaxID=2585369 RepID=A0A5C4MQV4_9RHOB|nr:diaminopimelate epimerase [Rubellimicrobium rubrum]TNC46982.1 diaminopimelate epimerase [Rubellimicrobium rubrum]